MQFTNVAIESIAYALPEEVWTSAEVEARLGALYQRLGLPEGRLELMTGIQERRFWPTEMPASEASALAGKAVLERSAFSAESMDLLIHSAVCRDRLEPATASYVHGLLGLPGQTQIFDLSNACLGFLNGLVVAGGLIESGQIDRALICSGENGRPLMEHTLRELLQPEQTRQSIKPYCQGDANGNALEMLTDSEELLAAGIGVAERAWARFKSASGWTEATPDRIITHQVGRAHSRGLFDALGLDPAKDFTTFETLGNIGSVSCPITLAKAMEAGAYGPGQRAALLGIGSGLSSLMLALEWPES